MIALRGISWDHPRGYAPLAATAEGYTADRPGVTVRWEKRSLQEFADYPIQRLSESYDLLVIDHPPIGVATSEGSLTPLDCYQSRAYLADQATHGVGLDTLYRYAGARWPGHRAMSSGAG